MAIIPTPESVTTLAPGVKRLTRRQPVRVWTDSIRDERARFAVDFLRKQLRRAGLACRIGPISKAPAHPGASDFLVTAEQNPQVAALLPAKLRKLDGLAREQGYVLHSAPDGPVALYAASPTGLIYAAATLAQLLEPAEYGRCGTAALGCANGSAASAQARAPVPHRTNESGASMPHVCIADRPEFRWRGVNWLIECEIRGWSYERGDGAAAFERRFIRKLDQCALYKINLVVADGFDWDTDKFPGYAAMMRRLNRAARLRGIRLCFGGRGAYLDGGFLNRTSYPSGKVYPCVGYFHLDEQANAKSREAGTCLANRALTRLRLKRIADFVRRVEPGMLYIHNLDTGTHSESLKLWALRCPRCRARWPNDDVLARDGMAGAFAEFYDALADAINSVRDPRADYRADRDCLLMMVSPEYTSCEESDADWRSDSLYWTQVSRLLRNRNIVFGLREQFRGSKSAEPRYARLKRMLRRGGNDHGIGSIYFFGGDYFFNSHPFVAGPMLDGWFTGADIVMHGCGHAYQEPQQLLQAEFAWNPRGGKYAALRLDVSQEKLNRSLLRLRRGDERPAGIFGKTGFLEAACSSLYGREAGPLVAEVNRMRGKVRLTGPGFMRFGRATIWAPVWSYLHPKGRAFRHCRLQWKDPPAEVNYARVRRLREVYREVVGLNRRAERLILRAAGRCTTGRDATEDLRWFASTLRLAGLCAEVLAPYLAVFIRAHRAAISGRGRPAALKAIAAFRPKLAALDREIRRATPKKSLCATGENTVRLQTAKMLGDELARMESSLGHENLRYARIVKDRKQEPTISLADYLSKRTRKRADD